MSFEEVRAICGLIGMIIFIGVFILGVGWALHPKNKDKMVENGNIPFKEDE
tara:strand:+ start:108 stop:260 length:153 start_codon:yes stop_codon:yes gene_type:complete